MEGFYDRCKQLFDAGKREEFIRYCRDSMAEQITLHGNYWHGSYWHGEFGREFIAMVNSNMGEWIIYKWDGQPQGYFIKVDGVTRWVDHPATKVA